ncbi:MAG: hypothetical protein IJX26_03875 [Clostridia bacterium]|nr:hypothetical protein [Clostridia bacterium]
MSKFKSFFKNPNPILSIVFSILSLAIIILTIVFLCLGFSNPLIYILYGISAIALTYLIYAIVYFSPKIKNSTINLLRKYKFTSELLDSYGYRSIIFAICSFIINIAYAVLHVVIAILSHSIWFGALATYYISISLIRGGIVAISRKRKRKKDQWTLEKQVKSYINCGIYLVLLNFALVGAIVQMVLTNQVFRYVGLMIYVMATYTFYKLTMSIYNLIKAKKQNDWTVKSIKNISFADSLVSILALQTAMLDAFGSGKNYIFNSLSGAAVSITIIFIGAFMIVNGSKKLKQLKEEKIDE